MKPEESEQTDEATTQVDKQQVNDQDIDQSLEQTDPAIEPGQAPGQSGFKQRVARFKAYYVSHKKLTIPLSVLVVVGLLLAVPATRYPILGLAIKKDFTATVLDSATNKPVSSVDVTIAGKSAKTDQSGVAKLSGIKVGPHQVTITKKYYTDAKENAFVAITGSSSSQLKMTATGRQVKAQVTNKITGKGITDATVKAADTEAKTDDKGEVTIVLPADKDTLDATVSAQGYNAFSTKITVAESDTVIDQNKFAVTPSGKVYFLSKRTGKINVMKSDLDGANSEVVLAATGTEDDRDTILLASQDWKFLALKSKRAGDKPASLYLIDTSTDKLTTMDEGDAAFTMTGWSGHTFVYQVYREKVQLWQPNKATIKSFNADTAKITALDNSAGEGTGNQEYNGTDYRYESYGTVILVGNQVSYTKAWVSGQYNYGNQPLAGKQNGIHAVNADGQNKMTLKTFDATTTYGFDSKLYEPKEVYFRVYSNQKPEFYELENDKLLTKGDLTAEFEKPYPTYLFSPSNDKVFWSEQRDGKNTLFIGNTSADEAKTVSELSEYNAYGWYTQEYLLASKNNSELYILPAAEKQGAVKITDYHKPSTTFYGYGGGYGGL